MFGPMLASMMETTSVEKAGNRKVYVPEDLKMCSHVYNKRGNSASKVVDQQNINMKNNETHF